MLNAELRVEMFSQRYEKVKVQFSADFKKAR